MKNFSKNSWRTSLYPDWDKKNIINKFNDDELIKNIIEFSANYPSLFLKLFNIHGHIPNLGRGLGRGEVLLYFLYDEITLGGNSSSIDIHINGIPYFEVKTASYNGTHWKDFRLGVDEFLAGHHLTTELVELGLRYEAKGLFVMPDNFVNFSKSNLKKLKILDSNAVQRIKNQFYKKLFNGRIGTKKILFFDSQTGMPVYYGLLNRSNVKLERVSSGQSKLLLKL